MLEFWGNISKWYSTQPFFTRTYLSVCILFTLLISLNLISSYHVFYTFEATFFRLHIWRPLTAFLFIEKLDIVFVVSLYMLYYSLYRLERQIATGADYAQFLWMLVLLLVSCIAIGTLIHVYFLTDMLIIALVFISAQKVLLQRVHLFSDVTIQSSYLPFCYLAIMVLFGHQLINEIIGLLLGIAYIQLEKRGDDTLGRRWLHPPKMLVRWCESFLQGRSHQQ